jgi:5-hydroxyisourate hydrolase
MGKLTTHVLDTASGQPARGMRIDVVKFDSGQDVIKTLITNSDGRVDGPILEGDALEVGHYELHFYAGDYLRKSRSDLKEPLFLDVIPIRFGIADTSAHYHVPLLLSPFGYSTYRGS